jgi:hypothetical protein
MSNENKQPLDAAVEATLEQAHQAIEQTRAEIARSQVLSQAEADLAQAIGRIAEEKAGATQTSPPNQHAAHLWLTSAHRMQPEPYRWGSGRRH